MATQYARPKWWQVYLTFPLLITLFVLEARLKISVRGHQAVQIGILLLVYGLVHLWLKANASALSKMDQGQYYRTITVIRLPVSQLPDPDADEYPKIELPASEIKGVLSNTFEMDYIDMDAVSVDEVSEGLKRENLSESYFNYVPLVDEDECSSKLVRNQQIPSKYENKRTL